MNNGVTFFGATVECVFQQNWDNFLTHVQILSNVCPSFVYVNMDNYWTNIGQILDKYWTNIGQTLDKFPGGYFES